MEPCKEVTPAERRDWHRSLIVTVLILIFCGPIGWLIIFWIVRSLWEGRERHGEV